MQGSERASEPVSHSTRPRGRRRGRSASGSRGRRHRRAAPARLRRRTRTRGGARARRRAALLEQPPAHPRVAHTAARGAHLHHSGHRLRGLFNDLHIR